MKKMAEFIDEHFEEIILSILLIAICVIMLVQIIMRFIFKTSLTWAEEVCRTCLIYSGFFCIAYCQKRGSAIKIDVIINLFPKTVRAVINSIGQVFLFVFYLFFFVNSMKLLSVTAAGKSVTAALSIPLEYVYFAMTIGMGLACLRSVEQFIRFVLEKRGKKV